MKTRHGILGLTASALLMAATPALASGPSAANITTQSTSSTLSTTSPTPSSAVDTSADANGYAEREALATKQADYRGGSYIAIGISGTALLVAVILLIILL